MKPVMVRELKPFSLAWLADELGCTVERTKTLVGDMMTRGIVRYRTGGKTIPRKPMRRALLPVKSTSFASWGW